MRRRDPFRGTGPQWSRGFPEQRWYYLLEQGDVDECHRHAERIRSSSRRKGLRDGHGIESRAGMQDDVKGAMGELSACKALWIPWPKRIDTFRKVPDLGEKTEVRTNAGELNLWLNESDMEYADVRRWIYMRIPVAGVVFWAGWISGLEAQKCGTWAMHPFRKRRCLFVPSTKLHRLRDFPLEDL